MYWILGRKRLRQFEVYSLKGYNKFDLPFPWVEIIIVCIQWTPESALNLSSNSEYIMSSDF